MVMLNFQLAKIKSFLIAFLLLHLLSAQVYAYSSQCDQGQCLIVIDAGSTGSRAHLYHYIYQNGLPKIEEIAYAENSPGLAKLGQEKQVLNEYFNKLLSKLKQTKPLPVFVYATAGMRLINDDNQQNTYAAVKQWFAGQKIFELQEARTITGKEEGLFGWVSVNYLLGTFGNVKHEKVGVLDFGGASIQLAFPIKNQDEVADKDAISRLTIAGHTYHIYSKSYLGMGFNEVIRQLLTDEYCFAKSYPMPEGLLGNGDNVKCEQDIEILSNRLHKVDQMELENPSQKVDKWYSLGALQYLHLSKPFESLSTSPTAKEIYNLGQSKSCQVAWEALKDVSGGNDKYLYSTCLASAYYYAVIVRGYGITERTKIHTQLENSSKKIDWTYGAVIVNLSQSAFRTKHF